VYFSYKEVFLSANEFEHKKCSIACQEETKKFPAEIAKIAEKENIKLSQRAPTGA